MNRNLRISLLGLGSVAAVAAPVALAVSCGNGESDTNWVLPEYQQRNDLGGRFNLADGTLDVGLELGYAPYNFMITDAQYALISAQSASDTDINTTDGMTPEQADAFMEMIAPAGEVNNVMQYGGGFDVYVAKMVAESLSTSSNTVTARLHQTAWEALIPELTTRNSIDAIIAGMTATEERNEVVGFSDSYLNATNVILYKKGTTAPTFESLRATNKPIAVQSGTTQATLAGRIFGMDNIKEFSDANFVELEVESGRADYAICEDVRATLAMASHPTLDQVTGIEQIQQPGSGNNIAIPGNTPVATMSTINARINAFTQQQRQQVLTTAGALAVYVEE